MTRGFSNHEVVTLAVYLLGGESHHVDTEDAAVKANELAPGRFTWKKHPDQINLEVVRVYLSDAKKPSKGAYLLGSGTQGWLLSEQGLAFARQRVVGLDGADLSRPPLTAKDRQRLRLERDRLLATEAFQKYRDGDPDKVTLQEAEVFFRVDDYVLGQARERKIVRILNMFSEDPELGTLVRKLASKVRGR